MSRVLPILFNTDMVRAILDGRKTVTRRLPSKRIENMWNDYCDYVSAVATTDCMSFTEKQFYEQYPPCQPGDILYVRETWNYGYIETSDIPGSNESWFESVRPDGEYGEYIKALSRYFYKADVDAPGKEVYMIWRPSIHMPKKAARIWLKVTDVRVERLQDINDKESEKEGFPLEKEIHYTEEGCPTNDFAELWDSTIKKKDLDRYGWENNPWVWVVEFDRCEEN